ncbi:MAG: ABC transporter ATP-binding protein [Desulfarculus sp.]|nr:ABC transporter ATP-binding protein [Desulfarculus sp.]
MDLLRLTDIHYGYHGRPPIFQGLDFTLSQGQRVGILGPNGAGKSTLFLLAMGLLTPQAGQVWALGAPRQSEKDFRQVRTRLGFCFQDPDDQLFSPTVLEDVAFGPLNQGRDKHQVRHLVADTLEMLSLRGFEERVTYHLSGGEKRLVSLATVLAMQPELLLLDEPTNGLDPETEARLEGILQKTAQTWAIISHDHAFLRRNCQELYRLHGGLLQPVE